MPKIFLAPFLIAGLLLLASCSSAQETKTVETPQAKSKCDEAKESQKSFDKLLAEIGKSNPNYRVYFLTQQYHKLETKECFTAVEIATARAAIDIVTNKLNP
jgi:hypothetical protein